LATGFIYAVFRRLAADPYGAAEHANMVIKLIGFVGNYIFIARVLRLPTGWAALGAAIFTLANNSYVQGGHVQLFTVAFAPVLATFLNETAQAIGQRRQFAAAAWGVASSVCLSIWLLTAFYMAWFFLWFAVIVLLITFAIGGVADVRAAARRLAQCWTSVAAALVTLVLTAAPFIWLYLPKAAETAVHSSSETMDYLLVPADTLNLGGDSLFYAWLHPWLAPYIGPNSEHATGFTPALLLLFLASLPTVIRNRRTGAITTAMALAAIGLWMLSTRFGDYSLWPFVYRFVPGAKAIRVVSRIQIFLTWPVVCIGIVGLASWRPSFIHRKVALGLASAFGIFLCAEQFNWWRIPNLDPAVSMAWLQSVPVAPAACRTFFVADANPADPDGRQLQSMVGADIQAMLIAEWLGLPTVNGFASVLPPDWDLLWTGRPDYLTRMRAYVHRHGIEAGLCRFDLPTRKWGAPE
jgi:hypothetical protein